jgi:hypothetical protein
MRRHHEQTVIRLLQLHEFMPLRRERGDDDDERGER